MEVSASPKVSIQSETSPAETGDRTLVPVERNVFKYMLTGDDDAAPLPDEAAVVVVHGFGASADDEKVDAVMVALSGAGYTAITYDARQQRGKRHDIIAKTPPQQHAEDDAE